MEQLTSIKRLIFQGDTPEAIRRLNDCIAAGGGASDEVYYLLGNAYRKQENWQQALNNYRRAIDLNPASAANEAHRMLTDILGFYHKALSNP
ncbi:MAG: tetratricopeptide repeat protein [Prevotellaceae bacterium]|jgi:tetratricopeptide (TPR) repeat protein|nr:tetratricopeptide repeat protein [Prevotellaceae bacterium]